jgi:hypothetical protein
MKTLTALLLGLMISSLPVWANERESNTESDISAQSSDDGHLYVKDLPKPVLEALAGIQRLSAKVEPDIEKFGTRFRQEVDQAVKKLRDAVKDRPSSDKKETP